MTLPLLFLSNFIFIFLKAAQQKNINGNHYIAVLPTSFVMAFAEVYIIAVIASSAVNGSLDITEITAIALGGGFGCIASMWSHGKIFKEGAK